MALEQNSHSPLGVELSCCTCRIRKTAEDDENNDLSDSLQSPNSPHYSKARNPQHISPSSSPSSSISAAATNSVSSTPPRTPSRKDHFSSNTVAHDRPLCPACVHAFLHAARVRRQRAIEERNALRQTCRQVLEETAPSQALGALPIQLQKAQEHLKCLRQYSNQLAMETAHLACRNEDRQARLQQQQQQHQQTLTHPFEHRQTLQELQASLLDGALKQQIFQSQKQVRRLRFAWACQAFDMFRLNVGGASSINDEKSSSLQSATDPNADTPPTLTRRMKHAAGIGKLSGLPLPHAGPELYGVLPPAELQSVLRLVASLTALVASCLGIALPHPILLSSKHQQPQTFDGAKANSNHNIGGTSVRPNLGLGDLSTQAFSSPSSYWGPQFATFSNSERSKVPPTPSPASSAASNLASSTASLATMVAQQVRQSATAYWNTGSIGTPGSSPLPFNPVAAALASLQESTRQTHIPPPLETKAVQWRIHHATTAVLAERDEPRSARYSLTVPRSQSASSNGSSSSSPANGTTSSNAMTPFQQDDEHLAIALQLLQNDIVALCIRAGAPVSRLWPAEAVLLNLHVLQQFCHEQANLQE